MCGRLAVGGLGWRNRAGSIARPFLIDSAVLSLNRGGHMCTLFGWPKPTGPYKVGLTTWLIADPSRLEPFQPASPSRRELMAHVWHPAQPGLQDDPLGGNRDVPPARA